MPFTRPCDLACLRAPTQLVGYEHNLARLGSRVRIPSPAPNKIKDLDDLQKIQILRGV